jgi:uncharacterized protein (TIGR03083 family)
VPTIAALEAAYDGQSVALQNCLHALPDEVADEPSRLPGWTVRELAFHVTEVPRSLTDALAADAPVGAPMTIAAYTGQWREAAAQIERRDREGATGLRLAEIAERLGVETAAMHGALATAGGDRVITARRGPIRISDLLTTRVNELIVHSLDLSASLPALAPVALDRRALGVSCRMLTAILAERVPGHTVEVRVPPYAAVQCVEGPRHTRGTPANVVEADAVTWVELATGRLSWADARGMGRISASGERADISEHLPVLS